MTGARAALRAGSRAVPAWRNQVARSTTRPSLERRARRNRRGCRSRGSPRARRERRCSPSPFPVSSPSEAPPRADIEWPCCTFGTLSRLRQQVLRPAPTSVRRTRRCTEVPAATADTGRRDNPIALRSPTLVATAIAGLEDRVEANRYPPRTEPDSGGDGTSSSTLSSACRSTGAAAVWRRPAPAEFGPVAAYTAAGGRCTRRS